MDAPNKIIEQRSKPRNNATADRLRSQIRDYSKSFKTSWVNLGQALHSVWQDKLYYAWGYDKFEYYVEQEVGLPKQLSVKLLKTYFFLEQEEPAYLEKEFQQKREAMQVPGYEAVNVLRLAKRNKELPYDDYSRLKKDVFEKGKGANVIRRDIASLIRERKQVDPIAERQKRSDAALRKLIYALETFEKDMGALKTVPDEIVAEASKLMNRLEEQL